MKLKLLGGLITLALVLTLTGCRNRDLENEKTVVETITSEVDSNRAPEPTVEIQESTKDAATTPEATETPVVTETPKATETPETTQEIDQTSETIEKGTEQKMGNITIEELCPEEVAEKREGIEYTKAVHETYHSNTTGLDRGVNILLPSGYSEEKKYPVLYLLHGIFGDEYSLINDSNCRIPEISSNLFADGLAKEMIIVLPNMFATTDPELKPSFSAEGVAPYDNFIDDLVNDLMPYINENYSTLTDRENTAIAGFSMGGRESLYIGIRRPDLFGFIGAIAPAPGLTPSKDWAMTHPGQLKESELRFDEDTNLPYTLMICCGSKDGTVGKFPENYHKIMEKNSVEHTWYEVPGADHDSTAIRSGLNNFMRAIFQEQ